MIRPGLALLLWLCIAVLVLANNLVGDTWIAVSLRQSEVAWYKVLVPAPYILLMAVIHARRTAGPRWFDAALVAALLWTPSTLFVDFFYSRIIFDEDPIVFADRFAFWWGSPYPLLVVTLLVAPFLAGLAFNRAKAT
jgi:hypothetical protein